MGWTKDNHLLALTEGKDGNRIVQWDIVTEKIVEKSPPNRFPVCDLSPDGETVVVIDNPGRVEFIDRKTGKTLADSSGRFGTGTPSGFLSPTGTEIATERRGVIQISSAINGTQVVRINASEVNGGRLDWSPDGTKIARFDLRQQNAEIIDRDMPKRVDLLHLTARVVTGSWSPDSKSVAIGAVDGSVSLWDVGSGTKTSEWKAYDKEGEFQVAWSPDGAKLATTGLPLPDHRILIWDVATRELLKTIDKLPDGHAGGYRVAWLPQSDALWVKMGVDTARVDLATGKISALENSSGGNALDRLVLSPNGSRLLVASYGTFKYRDENTSFFPGNFWGGEASWMPDSRRALIVSTGYDIDRRRRLGTLHAHGVGGNDDNWLCIGPDGHYNGSAGIEDHIVYVCQTEAGEHLTLTPDKFQKRYAWKNEPKKARLLAWE
jgi:WD40 repeat protein